MDHRSQPRRVRRQPEPGAGARNLRGTAHRRRRHRRTPGRAPERGDRALSIRLSGEFHVLLAECTGSPLVVRELQELLSRTSMLVAFFEAAAASECACEEHEEILVALAEGDAARALKAMHTHLSLIETRLTPRAALPAVSDVEQELRHAWGAARKAAVKRLGKSTRT